MTIQKSAVAFTLIAAAFSLMITSLAAADDAIPVYTPGGSEKSPRPNVLLICVDDLRNCLKAKGGQIAKVPNLDRLAAEGRYFKRHYVQSAICGPSRCSLLTGRRVINAWDLWAADRKLPSRPEVPVSFADHFQRHGYETVSIGKISHEPGGTMPPDYRIPQVPFSWDKAFAPSAQWKSPWHAFFAYSEGNAYNAVIRWTKDETPRLPFESANVGDEGYADYHIAQAGIGEINRLADGDRPFLLAVGFFKPHLPHNAPTKYWDMFPEASVGMPDNFFPPENVDPAITIHKSNELTSHYHWPLGLGNFDRSTIINQRRAYYATTAYVDAQIGRLLDAFRDSPAVKNTIVVLWSDHGWKLGEHRMFSKVTNFEIDTNSPLIIHTPGISKPGMTSDALVETVDIYPTLADLCGLPRPTGLAGQSLRPIIEDPAVQGKPCAYSAIRGGGGHLGHSVRTDRYRLVHWIKAGKVAQVELYDHLTDPGENKNIAAEHRETVARLGELLPSRMKEVTLKSRP